MVLTIVVMSCVLTHRGVTGHQYLTRVRMARPPLARDPKSSESPKAGSRPPYPGLQASNTSRGVRMARPPSARDPEKQ